MNTHSLAQLSLNDAMRCDAMPQSRSRTSTEPTTQSAPVCLPESRTKQASKSTNAQTRLRRVATLHLAGTARISVQRGTNVTLRHCTVAAHHLNGDANEFCPLDRRKSDANCAGFLRHIKVRPETQGSATTKVTALSITLHLYSLKCKPKYCQIVHKMTIKMSSVNTPAHTITEI